MTRPTTGARAPGSDPDRFLADRYDQLGDSPMQRKLRRMAPMPVGSVFIEWPDMTESQIREQFRLMKMLGYTCLKQLMARNGGFGWGKLAHWALDEGIIPFWYDEAGGEEPTSALLEKLGLDPQMDIEQAMAHPTVQAHQEKLLRERIDRQHEQWQQQQEQHRKGPPPKGSGQHVPGVNPQIDGTELLPETVPHFIEWLKGQYESIEQLKQAWNCHILGSPRAAAWQTWDDVARDVTEFPVREYRHLRDILAFKAETFIHQRIRPRVEQRNQTDPHEPVRAGGEMGLFLPFASRGTDMEQIAQEMAEGGSFYPSLHPVWHFEEVQFEFARSAYMQAAITADWAKGIWTATWESTGGPQYFSGGKAPFVPEVRDQTPGFTIDAGAMRQLMFSYLAAGFKGFGMWCWNPRLAGWEAGEFALVDRNLKPTKRTVEVGKVGLAARRYRREIWQGRKEPVVGLLNDWDSDAIWAAMSRSGRDKYKVDPIRARIGASRALIDANVPWEHVTARNLRAGLADRYAVIYLPAIISLHTDLLEILHGYAERGGRVVMDLPGGYFDEYGRMLPTDKGSAFEKLFGVEFNEFAYSNNFEYRIDGLKLEGFTAVMTPTTARARAHYNNGDPAIAESRVGQGSAVILGTQASLNCFRPGNTQMQDLLVSHTLGGLELPYRCEGALAYRLACPGVDHFFLINDGPPVRAKLTVPDVHYTEWRDAVTDEPLDVGAPIDIAMHDARWIRAS